MTYSVVPGLIDALVAQATTALPNVYVSDGYPLVRDSGDFLLVGADDIDPAVNSATAQESPGPFGTNRPRDEAGEISLVAYSVSGDEDPKAARDAVYACAQAVASLCRSTPTLGVTSVLWTGYGSSSTLRQEQTSAGAQATLSFSISFRARL